MYSESTRTEFFAAQGNLMNRLTRLPIDERFFWLNNFIEQIAPQDCMWNDGSFTGEKLQRVVITLEKNLKRLFDQLSEEEQSDFIRYCEEELTDAYRLDIAQEETAVSLEDEEMVSFDLSQASPLLSAFEDQTDTTR